MGDTEGDGLVVYNGHTSKLCRIESDFMKSTNPDFVIANQSYPLLDGLYGLTIIGRGKYLFLV